MRTHAEIDPRSPRCEGELDFLDSMDGRDLWRCRRCGLKLLLLDRDPDLIFGPARGPT